MIGVDTGVRVLGSRDLPQALELLARDPVTNVFVEYRSRLTQLEPRWLGGEMWGYFEDGALVSMCHVGANLVPVEATPEACAHFAARAVRRPPHTSTIVGPTDAVTHLWAKLAPTWSAPRELRWKQPHLVTSSTPLIEPDPLVRPTTVEDLTTLYPACVAMYTEEVGVSPEADGGRDFYRARIAQLINRGWSFARVEDGRVVFKAEIAAVTPSACQVQGVYVDPQRRGEGLAARGMAAVVAQCLAGIAPTVSLYVNAHNIPARAAYARVGFTYAGCFSTLMF